MISPVVDYKKWAEKYGISLEPIQCPECKIFFEPNQVFAMKGYRGLGVAAHGCGSDAPFRVVPVGEKLEFWEGFRPETGGANGK